MIFLSYRTRDSDAVVSLLEERLVAEFGCESVFRDRTRIAPGALWSSDIEANAQSRRIMLVVIGKGWHLIEDEHDRRPRPMRAGDEADWVAREVAFSLAAGNEVVPILIDGVKLRSAAQLRVLGLGELRDRQAAKLRTDNFSADVDQLIVRLRESHPELGPSFALFARDAEQTHDAAMGDRQLTPTAAEVSVDDLVAALKKASVSARSQAFDRPRESAPKPGGNRPRNRSWSAPSPYSARSSPSMNSKCFIEISASWVSR
ncbi:MAG: TIR domain-containing protein [Polyangiaceae bacterium]